MKSHGHALWLMPKDEIYKRFADLIKKLAGENNSSLFEPHVTLLGDIDLPEAEMIKRTKQLVSGQKQFFVTLKQINYEDYFFRTLFVKAEITEQLQNLYNQAKEIFEIKGISTYMPHLSILYGNYPVELKEKIIKKIGKDQTASFEIRTVTLMKGGEIKDWRIIGEFPFE